MKLTIVASRDLWPTQEVIASVVAAMASAEVVHIRMNRQGEVNSPVEGFVHSYAAELRHGPQVIMHAPIATGGRSVVYKRDYEMVAGCERVIAYFNPGHEMEGGTGHVVHAAMVRIIPVQAFTLNDRGELRLIGSDSGNPAPMDPDVLPEMEALFRGWDTNQDEETFLET